VLRYNHLMRIARRFVVSGRVQGVGFRYFALDAARREGLHGYVRNNADGSVEAVAEGESESVERFERAIRRGPSRSRVEHVTVDEMTPATLDAGFEIR
jgi:acylphosphatase